MKRSSDIIDIMFNWTLFQIMLGITAGICMIILKGIFDIPIHTLSMVVWILPIAIIYYIGFLFINKELKKYDPDFKR
jgi:hypothetical protein